MTWAPRAWQSRARSSEEGCRRSRLWGQSVMALVLTELPKRRGNPGFSRVLEGFRPGLGVHQHLPG